MKGLATITVCAASALLVGCASGGLFSGSHNAEGAEPARAAAAGEGEGAVLGALREAGLPKGECGMVLWTLDENRPAAVFRYLAGKSGEIVINAASVSLKRVEMDGANAFGVFESQRFEGDNGVKVIVDVRFSLGFDGGSYLERGLISVETGNGWRTVAPSAGLAGCRRA